MYTSYADILHVHCRQYIQCEYNQEYVDISQKTPKKLLKLNNFFSSFDSINTNVSFGKVMRIEKRKSLLIWYYIYDTSDKIVETKIMLPG